jgi:folate-binding Fe-S cluster repair protein YgfZ
MELLSLEEAALVDAALMSSQDKFLTRLAIYALRSLKQIAEETERSISEISPQEIANWVERDRSLQQQIELDSSFTQFFTNLVVSSLNPLTEAARAKGTEIESLTPPDIIAWFEHIKLKINN